MRNTKLFNGITAECTVFGYHFSHWQISRVKDKGNVVTTTSTEKTIDVSIWDKEKGRAINVFLVAFFVKPEDLEDDPDWSGEPALIYVDDDQAEETPDHDPDPIEPDADPPDGHGKAEILNRIDAAISDLEDIRGMVEGGCHD